MPNFLSQMFFSVCNVKGRYQHVSFSVAIEEAGATTLSITSDRFDAFSPYTDISDFVTSACEAVARRICSIPCVAMRIWKGGVGVSSSGVKSAHLSRAVILFCIF